MDFIIDKHYMNQSWGYNNSGYLILSNGNIMKYKCNQGERCKLENKLGKGIIVGEISPRTIKLILKLLIESRDYEGGTEDHTGSRDIGYTSYIGYLGSKKEELVLRSESMMTNYNANRSAIELVTLIDKIIRDL